MPRPGMAAATGAPLVDPGVGQALAEEAAQSVGEAAVQKFGDGLKVEAHAAQGNPDDVILNTAVDVAADLIVVGSKGCAVPAATSAACRTRWPTARIARCWWSRLIKRPGRSQGSVGDRLYVVVSGPPGSGKSTLAPNLAGELALPLLAKDRIKEALLASIPVTDVEGSRRIGRAAMEVLFALASESPAGAVLEANFHRTVSASSIGALPGPTVEVFCRCAEDVARQRLPVAPARARSFRR